MSKKLIFALCCMICTMFMCQTGLAQKARADAKIKSLRVNSVTTPVFQESREGSRGANGRWCRLDVEFETSSRGQWLNEVEVRWVVMIDTDELKRPAGLTKSVVYTDVKEGRHFACVYIKPKFFERYMRTQRVDPSRISVYAEVLVDGQRVARDEKKSAKAPDRWFTMLDKMVSFANELMPKSKTPFAHIDFDFYENEKVN